MLSPGPGDPAQYGYIVDTVRELVGKKPIMGVCLGNQILGKVFGSGTFKLKFGHRGSNHPVKDLRTGQASTSRLRIMVTRSTPTDCETEWKWRTSI